jgi:nucleotide-binding universal stress UspA family protein
MRILVPIKSITAGIPAALTGLNLAKRLDAKVIFLHVVDTEPVKGSFLSIPTSMVKALREIGLEVLDQVMEMAKEEGLKSLPVLLEGSPVDKILDMADTCDLLIMAPKVLSPEGKRRDTTQSVLEKSQIPVLLTNRPVDRFERFFIGFDGSKESYRVVEFLKGAPLEPQEVFIGYIASTEEKRKAAGQILEDAKEFMGDSKIPATTNLMTVDEKEKIADEIVKFSRDKGIDIILVGKTGKGAFKRFFSGSVSRMLIAQETIPVMLIS